MVMLPPPAENTSPKKWSARMPMTIGLISLAILVGGFGSWSYFSQISGAVVTSGMVNVDQNRQVIQHIDGGIVTDIMIKEGDSVSQGSVLMRLDPTEIQSALDVVVSQRYEMLARSARLRAESDGQTSISFSQELLEAAKKFPNVNELVIGQSRLFDARLTSMKQEIDQLSKRRLQFGNQIEGFEAQQTALGRQLELINEERDAQQILLNKGLAQSSRVLALQREEARMQGALGELAASVAETKGRITELEIGVLRLETRRREEAITTLRDLEFRGVELEENVKSLTERLSRLDIRAPVSGVVYGLRVFARSSVIRPAEPLMFLVPQDQPLVISTRISPLNIDQIHIDQPVTLRFSAFSARNTPELAGKIVLLSPDAFQDEATGQSFFTSEIVLLENEIDKLGNQRLLPGMPVEAFIQTESRSPIVYLVKPFADYIKKAFRED